MYYVPNHMYPYSYYVNHQVYNPDFMLRNNLQISESILAAMKGEATAINLYSQLASVAPNQNHRNAILHALEEEKIHLKQFTDLYSTFTGSQPQYEIDQVTFNSYQEGLQKALEVEVENYEEYSKNYLLTQHLPLRDVFLRACNDTVEHVNRFSLLFYNNDESYRLKDYGLEPFVVDIEEATKLNNTFRTALWTGSHLQVTVMSIDVGDDIGLEVHPTVDQFLRIEEGQGIVQMGDRENQLDFEAEVYDDYAIMVPAGKWHNLTNTGDKALKLYTIYAPPEHPFGTVHETKAVAIEAEEHD